MKPHASTRVPAVLDGLIAILSAQADLAGVQIVDGPVRGMVELEYDTIVIAPSSPESPGVAVTYERESNLGRVAYVEQVEATVFVSSFSGDEAMKPRRDRVLALCAAVQAALDANQTRADAWDSCEMGPEAAWHQVQSKDGATCTVGFTVVTRSVI